MQAFVKASQPLFGPRQETAPSQQTEIQQVRQAEDRLRIERRNLRKRRQLEDAAWQVAWQQQPSQKLSAEELTKPKRRARWGSRKAQEEQQQNLRKQRRQQSKQRQQEDKQWRLHRNTLQAQLSLLPMATAWLAVLMITDNCTRQCLGLPLFIRRLACDCRDGGCGFAGLVACQFAVPDFRSWHTLYCGCVSVMVR